MSKESHRSAGFVEENASLSSEDGGRIEGTVADREGMRRMGKKQELRRNFNVVSIFAFALVLLATWEGVLATLTFGLGNGGLAGLLYMYIVAAIFFILVAISMAEMASMAPTAGGQYHWVSEFAPPRFQKELSYVIGWLCMLGWQGGAVIGCYLAGTELQGLIVLNYDSYVYQRWHGALLVICMAWIAGAVNILGARLLPWVENLLGFIHLAGFVGVFVTLLVLERGSDVPSSVVWNTFSNEGGWSSNGAACLVGLLTPVIALLGSDCITHMAEEVKDTAVHIPRAMVFSMVTNSVLGFAMLIAFCYAIGNDITSVLGTNTGYPFIQVFFNITGSKASATGLSIIIFLSAFGVAVSNVATASRQFFAFSRDKGVPFHRFWSYVPAGQAIPVNAILFTILFSSLLPLIDIGSLTAFNNITAIAVVALLASYLVCIGCLTVRRFDTASRGPLPSSPFSLGRAGLPINIVSLCFLALVFVLSFFPTAVNPTPATMNWAVVVFVGVLAISAAYYVGWARHTYLGPVAYVRKEL